MNRTKIIATIGPASANREMLLNLDRAGVNVARLNGSHADADWHTKTIGLIRETVPQWPILFDTPGRKVRTMELAHEPSFNLGDTIVLTTERHHDGSEKIPVNYDLLHEYLNVGATILADDGTLRFTVLSIEGRNIHCRADVAGTLRSRKGINVPDIVIKSQLVTLDDQEMISFAKEHGVDYIGMSFVESAAQIEAVRDLICGPLPRIVSKVETRGGLDKLHEICEASDAIMIDRGDLSVETSLETLAVAQKKIIGAGLAAGRPVIVATEILQSMTQNPFPTKAEVTDITNAVLDGCSAIMLSGETAIGRFPEEAASIMRRVADAAADHHQTGLDDNISKITATVPHVMENAIDLICRQLAVTKIVALTLSGHAARILAAHQPRQPILAVSNDLTMSRGFNLFYGTNGVYADVPFSKENTDHIVRCLENLWQRGLIVDEDLILVTAVVHPKSGNRMNLVQLHNVDDLREVLGWKRKKKD